MNLSIVIPQIFYDVLARIIPGLITLGLGSLVWPGKQLSWERVRNVAGWFTQNDLPPIFAVLSILLAAYLIATVFEGIWVIGDLTHIEPRHREGKDGQLKGWYRWLLLQPRYKQVTELVIKEWEKVGGDISETIFDARSMMYDQLRIRNAEVGVRIVKLRAESHGYRRLMLGLICCIGMNTSNFWFGNKAGATLGIDVVLIAMLVGVAAAYVYREEQWYWSLCNNWLLLCRSSHKSKQA